MVRETGSSQRIADSVNAEDVATYLREHPDFFLKYPDLLQNLTLPVPNHGERVVDLQHYLLQKLRSDMTHLKEQQRELISTTRANLNNQNRVHAAVLFLLDAHSFEQLIQTITTDLAVLLDLDAVSLLVEANGTTDFPHVHRSGVRVVDPGTLNRWLGKRDVVLNDNITADPEIWGSAAGLVRSEVLIRLRVSHETPDGLLAFGSREPDTFHNGQGTELVSFLARVVERCIRAWLDLPT
ncbi:MAG TPA: DUF484 family protein [Azospirillaceae bacterium]|nr:DUF484 family protein [Azospirillaceae bacterium]